MNAPHTIPPRPATYQDVIDAPSNMVAEIVKGELHLHPRPAFRLSLAASALTAKIFNLFSDGIGGPGGWWILIEPEVHLGGDVLVPDLAGWRRERLPEFPDVPWLDLAPDWVCEVLSPSTRRLDVTGKRDAYGREGVRHLWLVDPLARTLEAFERREDRWWLLATLAGDQSVRLPPFDAAEFPLSTLWPDAEPSPTA